MNIEEIIRAWKAGKPEGPGQDSPESPIGNELSEKELEEVVGGQDAQEWNAMPNTSHKTVCGCWTKKAWHKQNPKCH